MNELDIIHSVIFAERAADEIHEYTIGLCDTVFSFEKFSMNDLIVLSA